MAETNSFDCGATDLLCTEETKSLCFFDDGDLDQLEPFDDQIHQANGEKGSGGSGSEPSILLPCLSEDCIGWMVERESEHLPRDDYLMRLRIGELDASLRGDALDWIIKGGKTWAVHLVAVACLSLAAKFDEVNVPNPVDLQAGEPRFLFEAKTIQRMEIMVLNYLKWNIKPYTPLNFVEYFLRKMNDDIEIPSGPLITISIQIILSTIKGIEFLEFKPSEIAAAVAVFVSGEKRAMDIDKALSIVEKGRVLKCIELIQDLISKSGSDCSSTTTTTITRTTNVANGSILLSSVSCCSPNGVLDAAACLSYKSDDRKVGSCVSSSKTNSPDKKRRKLDPKTDL
ncbi:hypothetical protein OROHE_015412 [Orobanche hederae]